ncbi:MAG: hypothetical protein V7730_21995 [Sulfitobacter sp.]
MNWLAIPIVLVAAVTGIRHITRPAAVITSVEEDTLQEIPDDAIVSLRVPPSLSDQKRIEKQHMSLLALHAMGEMHRARLPLPSLWLTRFTSPTTTVVWRSLWQHRIVFEHTAGNLATCQLFKISRRPMFYISLPISARCSGKSASNEYPINSVLRRRNRPERASWKDLGFARVIAF